MEAVHDEEAAVPEPREALFDPGVGKRLFEGDDGHAPLRVRIADEAEDGKIDLIHIDSPFRGRLYHGPGGANKRPSYGPHIHRRRRRRLKIVSAEEITVIRVVSQEGDGGETDPVRLVVSYWRPDGEPIGKADPINEERSAQPRP